MELKDDQPTIDELDLNIEFEALRKQILVIINMAIGKLNPDEVQDESYLKMIRPLRQQIIDVRNKEDLLFLIDDLKGIAIFCPVL